MKIEWKLLLLFYPKFHVPSLRPEKADVFWVYVSFLISLENNRTILQKFTNELNKDVKKTSEWLEQSANKLQN